jgi:hypothetical protein
MLNNILTGSAQKARRPLTLSLVSAATEKLSSKTACFFSHLRDPGQHGVTRGMTFFQAITWTTDQMAEGVSYYASQ